MMQEVRVTLPKPLLAQCRQGAALRWQLARASGVVNQKRDGGRDDSELDYLGIRAEAAVALAYGLDYSPYSLGIDGGEDLFADDIALDVKSTFHMSGQLLFKDIRSFKADIAVLVTASEAENVMRLVGWVTRERFHRDAIVEDLGHGRGMALSQSKLSKPEALWRFLVNQQNRG